MSELKSVWDGWKDQCRYNMVKSAVKLFGFTFRPQAHCAIGYLFDFQSSTVSAKSSEVLKKVGRYIQLHHDLPHIYHHPNGMTMHPDTGLWDAVIYANNELQLTPDQFREIDRLTQADEAANSINQPKENSNNESVSAVRSGS